MGSGQDDRLRNLQEQVKKLQSQKDTLLKELDSVEERFESTNRLYKRYFPLIIDSLAVGDTKFAKTCRDLGSALKKEESQGKIEYIFKKLKDAILKEDIGPVPGLKKKGLLSSFLGKEEDSFINEYKQSYHDILSNLRSYLDKKFNSRLDKIAKRVKEAENTEDISEIRESVFSLVFVYISDTSQDREKVNVFVREIVGKILDIESKLANSYQQTDSMFEMNKGFDSILSIEITGLREQSDVAKSLDKLKVQVSERLSSIENALASKKTKENAIKKLAQKNRHAFKTGFVKLKQELDEATQYTEELEKKLNQDQLTGAFNRRAYEKRIREEMARFMRYNNNLSLLVIDADHFKRINDDYGHAIGDKCLQEIIKRTIPLLRENDMLARYGGEEFVVIMPETDAEGAVVAAEKIRKTIEKIEFIYKKEKVRVTVSIGASQASPEDTDHQQIFERADVAVYRAKEAGRNRVESY